MPQKVSSRYAAQLKVELAEFFRNIHEFKDETYGELRKCLVQGAAAYVSVAQRHTPPSLGRQDIESTFYQTLEMDRVLEKNEKTNGLRVIYFLRECVRNPQTHRLKRMFGKLLRQGYEYVVVIHSKSAKRKGRWTYYKECKTISEARKYATEDYRGLFRAAWGLGFTRITGGVPPVFNRYLQRRPALYKAINTLSQVRLSTDYMEMEITNVPIPDNSAFLPGLDLTSSIASVRSMNKYMTNFFEKQREL